jgi:hypothetical protein
MRKLTTIAQDRKLPNTYTNSGLALIDFRYLIAKEPLKIKRNK